MPNELSLSDKDRKRSSLYVNFIDILFAVVLAQSFVFLSSQEGITTWIASPSENIVTIANTILAYTLVITSWVGYHTSTEQLPIKHVLRFVIDIILLMLYYMAFANVRSFANLLIIMCSVFVLYTFWTLIRVFEYPQNIVALYGLKRRVIQAAVFASIFLIFIMIRSIASDPTLEGVLLVCTFITLIAYRVRVWKGPQPQTQQKADQGV